MAKPPKRRDNPVPQNPGSASGAWKCKLCDGMIMESKESGVELGHAHSCLAHPDYKHPGSDKEW